MKAYLILVNEVYENGSRQSELMIKVRNYKNLDKCKQAMNNKLKRYAKENNMISCEIVKIVRIIKNLK